MDFLWKKQNEIEAKIEGYLRDTESCLSSFAEAFATYFAEGLSEKFEELVKETHRHESTADDRRREIEQSLYNRALIPELRGDLLGMLESLDTVPNKCESVLNQLLLESIAVPEIYMPEIRRLVQINVESYRDLCDAARHVLSDSQRVLSAGSKVDEKESESDRVEHSMLKSIFSSEIPTGEKILLRDLILAIGQISDRAENAADRMSIIAIKHHT